MSHRFLFATLSMLVGVAISADTRAHELGLSRAVYRATPRGLDAELSIDAIEAAGIAPELDADGDGRVADEELSLATPALRAALETRLSVQRQGAPCRATRAEVARELPDGLKLSATFACPGSAGETSGRVNLLEQLSHGHRQLARIDDAGGTRNELLHAGHREFAARSQDGSSAAPPSAAGVPWHGFVRMGVEHVVLGFDHLAFLFLLALSSPRLIGLLGLTAAFTLAHSVALIWTALGGAAPPSDAVEPLIALSIAYVAVENLLRAQSRHRWLIVFGFGLIHGFGFAGALAEVVAFDELVPVSLLSFNLGVELGQIAALAIAMIALMPLRRMRRRDTAIVTALNGLGLVVGLLWTAERTYHALDTGDVAGTGTELRLPPPALTSSVEGSDERGDPRAHELCAALHRLPARRAAECCGGEPGEYLYAECVSVLSRSLSEAGVALNADEARRCATAMQAELAGCEWVRPGAPRPAEACHDLLRGLREQGQSCRSSLECSGELRCSEQSSESRGRCLPPADNGAPCGGAVDILAALLLVRDAEERHPPCRGMCNRMTHRCEDAPALGAACRAHVQCGQARRCVEGACRAGAAPVLQRARPGESCETDLDCHVGGCTTSASGARVCGMRCLSGVLGDVGLASRGGNKRRALSPQD
jgi:hypothetical protein